MFCASAIPSSAQELQTLRDEVRNNDPAPSGRDEPSHHHDDYHDPYDGQSSFDEDGGLSELMMWAGGYIITSPYWAPITLLGDGYDKTGYFAGHPYQYDIGYMMFNPEEAHGMIGPREPHWLSVRARTEYGTDFSGLNWIGANLLIEGSPRVGLECDFRNFQEELPGGGPAQFDSAWLGDANLFFRFVQTEMVQMRSGIGINFLSDRQQTDVGFNFTYAGDLYPVKPWVISGEFDLGLLGDETLWHVRLSTGVTWKGIEAFIGYDMVDIGSFHTDSLVTGIRLWF